MSVAIEAEDVTDSPWDPVPVRKRLAHKMDAAIDPEAWVLDDTGYLKSGDASVCVARQYTGTAGKVTNCQVGVTIEASLDPSRFVPCRVPGSSRPLQMISAASTSRCIMTPWPLRDREAAHWGTFASI